MLWKLFPQILCCLTMVLVALLDYKWFDKRTKNFRRVRRILFMVLSILMAASIFAVYHDHRAAEEQIQGLSRQLVHLEGIQTGGNSFCYLSFSFAPATADTASLVLVQQGEYPLYRVQVLLHDLEAPLPTSLDQFFRRTRRFEVAELAQEAVLLATGWPLPPTGRQDYNIQIGARNGWLRQAIRLRKVAGQWRSHTVVFRDTGDGASRELLRRTDPGFPADAVVK